MKRITEYELDKAYQKFTQLSTPKLENFVADFANNQEVLFGFIMTPDEDLGELERQALVMMAIQLWFILSQTDKNLPKVTPEFLEDIAARNEEKLVEVLHEDQEDNPLNLIQLLDNHTQPELLRTILIWLKDEELTQETISTNHRLTLFFYLFTFIDAILEMPKN